MKIPAIKPPSGLLTRAYKKVVLVYSSLPSLKISSGAAGLAAKALSTNRGVLFSLLRHLYDHCSVAI